MNTANHCLPRCGQSRCGGLFDLFGIDMCFGLLYVRMMMPRSLLRGFCYTLSDEVRPSRRDMYYGMPFGYTLSDEVRPSRRDMHYGMPFGYTIIC